MSTNMHRIIIGDNVIIHRPDRPQALRTASLCRLTGVDVRIEPIVEPTRKAFTPAEDCMSKARLAFMQDCCKMSRPGF